ncbi:MAG: phycobiliprotein lyase [Cyanobacteria bacterium SW_10_48_33]|nr:MAG: phycobiliprotein lyase [Cyanobacteria bacterium QS_3_48_167]PSO90226.1 MAG: phycobiliprotein lyase [Cyanobacteria bacterium QS_6_48_18]PSP12980.1 MAG: phycobiliprotein lyase [Cyanobacteria bacterium SW_10_48_33]
MDAMEFFQRSAGSWRSQRTTHHLPFRQAEAGGSEIQVETLAPDDSRVIEICQLHQVDPSLSVGGALVSWDGSMAWDKEDENHQGKSVFSLVPDDDTPKRGRLLRERGYAEVTPVVGRYEIDEDDALVLSTDYETMSIIERFWFPSPNLRIRTSTVKRFGGLNTATFCAEIRTESEAGNPSEAIPETKQDVSPATELPSIWGW